MKDTKIVSLREHLQKTLGIKLVEEAFLNKDAERVISLVAKLISKNLSAELYREPGAIKFVNNEGTQQGVRFFIGNTDAAIRLNLESKNDPSFIISSIDLWQSKSDDKTPDFRIDFEGLNIVSIINHITKIIKNPVVGVIEVEDVDTVDDKSKGLAEEGAKEIEYEGKVYSKAKEAIAAMVDDGLSKQQIEKKTAGAISSARVYGVLKELGVLKSITVTEGSRERIVEDSTTELERKTKVPESVPVEELYEDLEFLVNMIVSGNHASMLICGQGGTGKTVMVTEQIKKAGLEEGDDWVHVKGKATPVAIYRELFYARQGSIVVFDDCDAALKVEDAVAIFKAALDSAPVRKVSWKSSRTFRAAEVTEGSEAWEAYLSEGKFPDVFEFKGRVIFISNLKMSQMDNALKSRSFTIDIDLMAKDMLKRIKMIMDKGGFDSQFDRTIQQDAYTYLAELVEKDPESKDGSINLRSFLNACKFRSSGSPIWHRLLQRYAMFT